MGFALFLVLGFIRFRVFPRVIVSLNRARYRVKKSRVYRVTKHRFSHCSLVVRRFACQPRRQGRGCRYLITVYFPGHGIDVLKSIQFSMCKKGWKVRQLTSFCVSDRRATATRYEITGCKCYCQLWRLWWIVVDFGRSGNLSITLLFSVFPYGTFFCKIHHIHHKNKNKT